MRGLLARTELEAAPVLGKQCGNDPDTLWSEKDSSERKNDLLDLVAVDGALVGPVHEHRRGADNGVHLRGRVVRILKAAS